MPNIPPGISRTHLLKAIRDIDGGKRHRFGESTRYDVLWDGRRYAPKAVVGLAAHHAAGSRLGPYDFKGGLDSKCFAVLKKNNFRVVNKGHGDVVGREGDLTPTQIRNETLELARRIRSAVADDERCAAVLRPRQRKLRSDYTFGYWAQIGRLGRRLSLELWVDHYAGGAAPHAWFGVSARDDKLLLALLKTDALRELRQRVITRTNKDIVDTGTHWAFRQALTRRQFDTLVHERYSQGRRFLGTFSPYRWPFSANTRRAICREAVNLGALLSKAFAELTEKGSSRMQRVGPWGRADRQTEEAAIRHVTRDLERKGYQVISREDLICGYDLEAKRKGSELHVEVKGCASTHPRFFISRTELNRSKTDRCWRLVVITSAKSKPCTPQLLNVNQMNRLFALAPTQWEGIGKAGGR